MFYLGQIGARKGAFDSYNLDQEWMEYVQRFSAFVIQYSFALGSKKQIIFRVRTYLYVIWKRNLINQRGRYDQVRQK